MLRRICFVSFTLFFLFGLVAVAAAWDKEPRPAVEEVPEVPDAPHFYLPLPADDIIVVANDPSVDREYSQIGYFTMPTIQQAVDVAEPGSTIYITSGEYRESVAITYAEGLTLIGEEGVLVVSPNDLECFFIGYSNGVNIRNIDVVHEDGSSPCSHHCFAIWDSSNMLIDYCDISGCGYYGVQALAWDKPMVNVVVDNCVIHDCAVAIYGESGGGVEVTNTPLVNNGQEYETYSYDDYGLDTFDSGENEILDGPPEKMPQPQPVEILPPGGDWNSAVVSQDTAARERYAAEGHSVYSSIQAALDDNPSMADIYVMEGTYYENLVLESMDTISIFGMGEVLVEADNDEDVIFLRECFDVYIYNIDMVHTVGESPCLHNCIVFWDCELCTVDACDLSGCGYIGVEVLGNGNSNNIMVNNCTIHDCAVGYYDVTGYALSLQYNTFWNCDELNWTLY
jgi:hypothetical protein